MINIKLTQEAIFSVYWLYKWIYSYKYTRAVMSYDLYFFKRKETDLTREGIADYLTRNLNVAEANNQWLVEDEDTGTYFSFDLNEPDPETDEEYEDFNYTFFTFNLNFIRPDFFGIHAFRFVDQLVKDLDLYVLNPQEAADTDTPRKPLADELYRNWSVLNARHAADFFEEFKLNYLSLEKSNDAYFYRLNRQQLQEDLGEGYFVAGLYFYRKKSDNSIITISS